MAGRRRADLLPERPRAQPRVRRHAHRQPRMANLRRRALPAFWLFMLFALNPVPAIVIAFLVFVKRLIAPPPPSPCGCWRARDLELLSFIVFFARRR